MFEHPERVDASSVDRAIPNSIAELHMSYTAHLYDKAGKILTEIKKHLRFQKSGYDTQSNGSCLMLQMVVQYHYSPRK